MAPEVNLLVAKALDASGSGYLDDIIAAIDWSVQNGAQVISMSFGRDTDYQSLHDACDAAYAQGVVLVAAAGNDAKIVGRVEFDTIDYPARYDSVIAVGATDENDERASWSSTGSALELAATGVDIYSTLPTYTVTLSTDYGYEYGTLSGTSMACPHVSGTVVLILASPEDAVIDYNGDGINETNGDGVWTPDEESDLAEGIVTVSVTAEDMAETPNSMTYSWSFTIDLTPPTISNVAVSDVSSSSATITWTTDEPSDSVVHYSTDKINWNTESNQTSTTAHSITLTGLSSETTYYFYVQSTDAAGNIAADDNNRSYYYFTTLSAPTNTMHIASIDMSTVSRTAGPNIFVKAIATITIVDANDNPVEGATIYGHWEGATTDSDSGITDAGGQVSLESDQVKNPPSGTTFTFVVDDVVKEGWTYDSSANVETSDSITI